MPQRPGTYSFLCVYRGSLVEQQREYSSDEEESELLQARPRQLWTEDDVAEPDSPEGFSIDAKAILYGVRHATSMDRREADEREEEVIATPVVASSSVLANKDGGVMDSSPFEAPQQLEPRAIDRGYISETVTALSRPGRQQQKARNDQRLPTPISSFPDWSDTPGNTPGSTTLSPSVAGGRPPTGDWSQSVRRDSSPSGEGDEGARIAALDGLPEDEEVDELEDDDTNDLLYTSADEYEDQENLPPPNCAPPTVPSPFSQYQEGQEQPSTPKTHRRPFAAENASVHDEDDEQSDGSLADDSSDQLVFSNHNKAAGTNKVLTVIDSPSNPFTQIPSAHQERRLVRERERQRLESRNRLGYVVRGYKYPVSASVYEAPSPTAPFKPRGLWPAKFHKENAKSGDTLYGVIGSSPRSGKGTSQGQKVPWSKLLDRSARYPSSQNAQGTLGIAPAPQVTVFTGFDAVLPVTAPPANTIEVRPVESWRLSKTAVTTRVSSDAVTADDLPMSATTSSRLSKSEVRSTVGDMHYHHQQQSEQPTVPFDFSVPFSGSSTSSKSYSTQPHSRQHQQLEFRPPSSTLSSALDNRRLGHGGGSSAYGSGDEDELDSEQEDQENISPNSDTLDSVQYSGRQSGRHVKNIDELEDSERDELQDDDDEEDKAEEEDYDTTLVAQASGKELKSPAAVEALRKAGLEAKKKHRIKRITMSPVARPPKHERDRCWADEADENDAQDNMENDMDFLVIEEFSSMEQQAEKDSDKENAHPITNEQQENAIEPKLSEGQKWRIRHEVGYFYWKDGVRDLDHKDRVDKIQVLHGAAPLSLNQQLTSPGMDHIDVSVDEHFGSDRDDNDEQYDGEDSLTNDNAFDETLVEP